MAPPDNHLSISHSPHLRGGASCTEDELLVAVMRLKRALHQSGSRNGSDLEIGAFPVLHHLACAGAARPGQIASAIGLDASTVSRYVSNLTKRQFIVSLPDPTDGRASVLSVTARGAAFLDQTLASRRQAIARGVAGLSAAECRELVRLLHQFSEALSATADEQTRMEYR